VDAFCRHGVQVIFAESNGVTTVIVVQTDVHDWSDIASNTRHAFNSDILQYCSAAFVLMEIQNIPLAGIVFLRVVLNPCKLCPLDVRLKTVDLAH